MIKLLNRPSFHQSSLVTLIRHFSRRILASDEEQDGGGIGLGLGTVLAILAIPGGFASLFLLDKYSTLLQWLRGQARFNPHRASVGDEYFFVVLSMTITGLVMVLRWNRLLPDRRDFANLATMPIPIRNVFLANLIALLGLGLLIGVDINAVSSFVFPLFVTLADNSAATFLKFALSHGITVLLASAFSFFAVFALVGVLMLLPAALFRPVSLCVRLLLVVGLLTECSINLFLQLFAGRIPAHPDVYLRSLPSFWFLGIYERAAGLASPEMFELSERALVSLATAIVVGLLAYAFCYRKHFLHLAENMDRLGNPKRSVRITLPRWSHSLLFANRHEHACCAFSAKALFRSERHLMAFGAYLGIGLVFITNNALLASRGSSAGIPDRRILEIPLLLTFFVLTGLRFAFELPAVMEANWVFRVAPIHPGNAANPARKLMMLASIPWQLLLVLPIAAVWAGWTFALEQTVWLLAFSFLLMNILLSDFRRIPFTSRPQRDTRQMVIRVLGALFSVAFVVPWLARLEHWALGDPLRAAALLLIFTGAWYSVHSRKGESPPEEGVLSFEATSTVSFDLLKLAQQE